MLSGSLVAFVSSDIGQLLGLVSVLVDLGQRPDEARPFVGFGDADLLRRADSVQHEDRRRSITPSPTRGAAGSKEI